MLSKKIITLSLVATTLLNAQDVELNEFNVESTLITEVAQNAQVSADLAQALSSYIPSIDMSRRSGIANDILIRGQKRDNISIEVDGTKVQGACVNRMDPPVSHVLTSQIDTIEVIEGPYDVENFGTLSGGLKITTKKPTKELQGELNLGMGSWGYKKVGATVSGGNDKIRLLVSASYENSGQYEDGDGNTIAQQVDKAIANGTAPAATAFQDKYRDQDAYTKSSVMSKMYVTLAQDHELRLSYTGNRSDDVLYGNSKMDAAYDDSNIYSVEYNVDNLTKMYKNVNLQYYYSEVTHPMDTRFRVSGTANYMTNHLETSMEGLKLKNTFDLASYKLLLGLDGSRRTWEGRQYNTIVGGAVGPNSVSLTHTETDNKAIFAKVDKSFNKLDLSVGARYDSTDITPDDATKKSNDYNAFSANILASYHLDKHNKLFLGFGEASRVPDARELYLPGPQLGNEDLEQTTNTEVDFGYELNSDSANFKIKGFYSWLEDYISYNKTINTFENVDATIYGAELSASYFATDSISIDAGASYKVGEKDEALSGQNGTNLADMAPLRGNVGVNYEYANNSMATLELQASDKWDDIDKENGEQELAGWAVMNMKVKHALDKHAEFTVGVNNILDATYAVNNTYADLILLTTGGDTMLMNEPGRYFYTNLTLKF
jgi:iron complex outermembrane receptor protein